MAGQYGFVDFSNPTYPMWYRLGFPSKEAYDNANGSGVDGVLDAPLPGPSDATVRSGDAYASLTGVFDQLGLSSLSDWAWDQIVQGRTTQEILNDLYNPKTQGGAEVDRRFPEIRLRREAGLTPISVGDAVNYRSAANQLAQQYNLPRGMLNPTDLLVQDVSVVELEWRIGKAYARVANAPVEVQQYFAETFGASGSSALAALFLDPDKATPELENMVGLAQVGGTANMVGLNLNRGRAQSLFDLGVSPDQVRMAGQQLGEQQGLFVETVDEKQDMSAEIEGLDAVFGLGDQGDAMRGRLEDRRSAFGNGQTVEAYSDRRGATGLGKARS